MADIIVYSSSTCPYCDRAKALLKEKGASYREISIEDDQSRYEMIELSNGRRTVPQIFIDGNHIGGFDDLRALDLQGKLDPLL